MKLACFGRALTNSMLIAKMNNKSIGDENDGDKRNDEPSIWRKLFLSRLKVSVKKTVCLPFFTFRVTFCRCYGRHCREGERERGRDVVDDGHTDPTCSRPC